MCIRDSPCQAARGHTCVRAVRGALCLRRSAGIARGLGLPPAQRWDLPLGMGRLWRNATSP
eukprot:6041295-Alexandrium_andersonii.AAC.1